MGARLFIRAGACRSWGCVHREPRLLGAVLVVLRLGSCWFLVDPEACICINVVVYVRVRSHFGSSVFIEGLCVVSQILALIAMSSSWEQDAMSGLFPPDPFGPDGPVPPTEALPRSSVSAEHVATVTKAIMEGGFEVKEGLEAKESLEAKASMDDLGATGSMDDPWTAWDRDDESMKAFESQVLDDNWTVYLGKGVAFCKSCDTWIRSCLIQEHMDGMHRKKMKKRMKEEQEEHEKALQKESLQDKITEILECLEDHPQFLKGQFIEFGSFLRITAIDEYRYSTRSQEFLITSATDHTEVIFEAMAFLNADKEDA